MAWFYQHHANEYHDVYMDDLEVSYGDLRVYMQQDSASSHKAKKTQEALAATGMQMLENWPPCSRDLTPTEGRGLSFDEEAHCNARAQAVHKKSNARSGSRGMRSITAIRLSILHRLNATAYSDSH